MAPKLIKKATPAPVAAPAEKVTVAVAPAPVVTQAATKATKSALAPKKVTPAPVHNPSADVPIPAPVAELPPPSRPKVKKAEATPAPAAPKAEAPAVEKKGLPRTVAAPEPKFKDVMESKRFKYVRQASITEDEIRDSILTGTFPVRIFVDEGREDTRITELVAVYLLDGTIHCIDTTVKGDTRNSHVPLTFEEIHFDTGKLNGLDFALYLREEKEAAE